MATVYLGLGSNLGDREKNISSAIEQLKNNKDIKVLKEASVIETEPEGDVHQNKFLNTAVKIETGLAPLPLLDLCLSIEDQLGRARRTKWGPRTIDIDILFYAALITTEKELLIPHPHLHSRKFVLRSLLEISPELIHPVFKKPVHELAEALLSKGYDKSTQY